MNLREESQVNNQEFKLYKQLIKFRENEILNADCSSLLFEICPATIFLKLKKIYEKVGYHFRFIMMLEVIRDSLGEFELIKMKEQFIQLAEKRRAIFQKQIDIEEKLANADIFHSPQSKKKTCIMNVLKNYYNAFEIFIKKGMNQSLTHLFSEKKQNHSPQYFHKKIEKFKELLQQSEQTFQSTLQQQQQKKIKQIRMNESLKRQNLRHIWKFGYIELKKGSIKHQYEIKIEPFSKKKKKTQGQIEEVRRRRRRRIREKKRSIIQLKQIDISERKEFKVIKRPIRKSQQFYRKNKIHLEQKRKNEEKLIKIEHAKHDFPCIVYEQPMTQETKRIKETTLQQTINTQKQSEQKQILWNFKGDDHRQHNTDDYFAKKPRIKSIQKSNQQSEEQGRKQEQDQVKEQEYEQEYKSEYEQWKKQMQEQEIIEEAEELIDYCQHQMHLSLDDYANSVTDKTFLDKHQNLVGQSLCFKNAQKYSLALWNSSELHNKYMYMRQSMLEETKESKRVQHLTKGCQIFSSWVFNWTQSEDILISRRYFNINDYRSQSIAILIELQMMLGKNWLIEKADSFRIFIESKANGLATLLELVQTNQINQKSEKKKKYLMQKYEHLIKRAPSLIKAYMHFIEQDGALMALMNICSTKTGFRHSFEQLKIVLPELKVRNYVKSLNNWCVSKNNSRQIYFRVNFDPKNYSYRTIFEEEDLAQKEISKILDFV